ncbi:MAG: hypothetical protein OXH79_07215 [Boseongicola sp.]|nr:hypothetical protein [Boseongicola sp.]
MFAESDLAGRMNEPQVGETVGDDVVGHVGCDTAASPPRERAADCHDPALLKSRRQRGGTGVAQVQAPERSARSLR